MGFPVRVKKTLFYLTFQQQNKVKNLSSNKWLYSLFIFTVILI